MASIKINGHDLDVKQRQAPGGLGLVKKLVIAEAAVRESSLDYPDRAAELVLIYVGHNPGVDATWLLDNLPADLGELTTELITASGGKLAAPGEAKGQ